MLLVSSELDGIYALSDRIAVMYGGRITGLRPPTSPDLTYAMTALAQVRLLPTRWGLRVRVVGGHPAAADTVGIKALAARYRNVIMGGLIAGIGGVFLTIGLVGTIGKDMSSGKGYAALAAMVFITLAAMVFGRRTPLGATTAALLSGFATSLHIPSTLNVPIPSNILLMTRTSSRSWPWPAWWASSVRPGPTASRT